MPPQNEEMGPVLKSCVSSLKILAGPKLNFFLQWWQLFLNGYNLQPQKYLLNSSEKEKKLKLTLGCEEKDLGEKQLDDRKHTSEHRSIF